MPNVTDDLEQLLAAVRNTIRDNHQFLKSLGDDDVGGVNAIDAEEETVDERDFEEL